jgi:hypothetical protein
VGFIKYAVHQLGNLIVAIAANYVVPKDMKLGPRQDEDARTSMRYEWIAEMSSLPDGSLSRFWFALQTLCTAVKFHSIAREQRRSRPSPESIERPASLGS